MNFPNLCFSLPKRWRSLRNLALATLAAASIPAASAQSVSDGPLKMEIITAYNFVVDSNVESPSTKGPAAAHLAVRITNTGATPLSNVVVNLGDYDAGTSTGSPGIFPSRTVSLSGSGGYAGTFQLVMPGGAIDAVRSIASLPPGASSVQYFFVTYPQKDSLGRAVTGQAPVVTDDLWLNYDAWASAQSGAGTHSTNVTAKVTMRNEIAAMANKINPNTTSKVPPAYLAAIESSLGWRPASGSSRIPGAIVTEGIWYDLGTVGAGFDNNGDLLPDRNAWMQPVGDPGQYSPLNFRLVKCYGIVVVKLNDGTERLMPFEDRLYFENLPPNNTGAIGLVYYEFMPLTTGSVASTSPYQEVASGYDNEKFNADYGSGGTYMTAAAPALTLDKTAPVSVSPNSTVPFSITATNTGASTIGDPNYGVPFAIEDDIPAGVTYQAGSAVATTVPTGNTVTISYATGSPYTWSTTEPVDPTTVRAVRWTLTTAGLKATESFAVGFQVNVPAGYSSRTLNNTAIARYNGVGVLASDSTVSLLTGPNSIGDLVWFDADRNGLPTGETGLANIGVSLYYDANGNGIIDADEPVYATTETDASGIYGFTSLPDGNYIVVVDHLDPQLPQGYVLPGNTAPSKTVALDVTNASGSTGVAYLDADWPFIEALLINKRTDPTTYEQGDLVTYFIDVENHTESVPDLRFPVQTAYATSVYGARTAQNGTLAQGSPDANFARIDFSSSSDQLVADPSSAIWPNPKPPAWTWTFPDKLSNIVKVELVIKGYVQSLLASKLPLTASTFDDTIQVHIDNADTGSPTPDALISAAQLIAMQGSSKELVINMTNLNNGSTFSWAQLEAAKIRLRVAKVVAINNDNAVFWTDAIGIRVTTDAPAPPTGTYGDNTLDPVPLKDVYNPAQFDYVSATPVPSNVVTGTGTVTWDDVGPVNPGTRRTVSITLRAKGPSGTLASEVFSNTASTANAYYADGRRANSAQDIQDVTILQRARIGDLVYWDMNSNGVYDAGEGLANVLVVLDNGAQAYTDANGNYLFEGLSAGTYTVTVDESTLPFSTFTNFQDPNGGGDSTSSVTLATVSGQIQSNLDQDFGYRSTQNAISGSIFMDNNGDGNQDPGENYISGLTVNLYNGSVLVATTTTDANGYYLFPGLSSLNYRVEVIPPGGTVQTFEYGNDGTLDSSLFVNASGTSTLYPNRDFAYQPQGSFALGDTVYLDVDGDSTQDAGEPGIAGVTVSLYEDENGDGLIDPTTDALIATDVTDASGVYGFPNLPAAKYLVLVDPADLPANAEQTQDYDGVADNSAKVEITTASISTVDFGYVTDGTGSIGNKVFVDTSADGIHDAYEVGIPSITVRLYYDSTGDGILDANDVLVAETSTDADGNYLFSGLPPANYLVDVDAADPDMPADYLSTSDDPHSVSLAAAQTYLLADFGFAPSASVGDMVFYDNNGNGTQDWNEPGIGGVNVSLYRDTDGDGIFDPGEPEVASTVTNSSDPSKPVGFYLFSGLPEGQYVVVVRRDSGLSTVLSGLVQTADPDRDGVPYPSTEPAFASLPPSDDADTGITLTPGLTYTGADFGYQPSVVIGDTVWFDLDADGFEDAGESGIANVSLTISNGSTNYQVTTDFDGKWSLANIPDGSWTITVDAANFAPGGPLHYLAPLVPTFDPVGGTTSPTTSATFTVSGGVVQTLDGNADTGAAGLNDDIDFGFALGGDYSLSGTIVTNDGGTLGTADTPATEIELAGFTVYLYDGNNKLLGTTQTDAFGNYSFDGLVNGTYQVLINKDTPALSGATLNTTTANNAAVSSVTESTFAVVQTVAIAGVNVADVDFAFSAGLFDFGDLPASYNLTSIEDNGARHAEPSGGFTTYLGNSPPDTEVNGAESLYATGDGADENGILFNANAWTAGATVTDPGSGSLSATITGSGWLVVWIDWNNDGDFLDSGEMVISQPVADGDSQNLGFSIPPNTLTNDAQSWYSRARLFTSQPPVALLSYSGEAIDGEVEDYYISRNSGDISGTVLADSNNDGTGDAPLAGVTITLYTDAGSGVPGTILATTTTDADGNYSFTGLPSGNYVVVQTPPDGYQLVADGDTTDPADDLANASTTDNRIPVTLTPGESDNGNNFVNVQLASVGDYVWWDVTGDGIQDASEFPISGARVYLDLDDDGTFDVGEPSDVTDLAGAYLIEGVLPGNYKVRITDLPAGATPSFDLDGTTTANVASISLTPGQNLLTADFGYTGNSSIGDYVWNDANGDGIQDTNELPISGITVFLDLDNDGVKDANEPSDVTDAAGAYSIGNLPPGTYTVTVVKDGAIASATSTGDPDSTKDNKTTVTLGAADTHTTADFGYQGSLSIGDFVWNDTNGDGVQDVGETGISSLYVFIDTDGDGTRDTHEPFAQTDASGAYAITGLLPGTYQVTLDPLTIPAGVTITGDPDATKDGTSEVTLTTASINTVDFGLYQPSGTATIGGHLWEDRNGNGVLDPGEPFLVGVDVFLDIDGDGVFDAGVDVRTTTNADGEYSFGGLTPGTYTVSVDQATLPGGSTQTFDKDGGLVTPNHKIVQTVAGGDIVTDMDFGYRGTGSIGDYIWNDANGDGVQDATELPISGVHVYLDLDGDGNWDSATEPSAISDSNGAYSLGNLLHGTYTVAIDLTTYPDGSSLVTEPDAIMDGEYTVTLDDTTPSISDADFGFQGNSSIGDTVWYDMDGDGTVDPGENLLSGVTVFLDYNNDGDKDANEPSDVTDGSGLYLFEGLIPGTYVVRVSTSSLPAGLTPTYDLDSIASADVATVTLPEATDLATADFGYRGTATVKGRLYLDTNGNGVQDPGEEGLANVDVLVTDANGLVHRVTTDADGNWSAAVPPGSTLAAVDLTDPNLPDGAARTQGDDTTPITAVAGSEVSDVHDGFYVPGGISGKVEVDTTGDGIADEPRAGVTIKLYTDAGGGVPGTLLATTTTAADGSYSFTSLPAGDYVVVQTLPTGYVLVKDGDSTPDTDTVANTDTTDNRIPVTIGEAEVDTGNDFLIRTECPTSWAEWQALNPLGGSNGPTANPDGDRWSNLQEFVYCFDPSSGVDECAIRLVFNPDGTIDACVHTVNGITGVTYSLEYIADLNSSGPNGAGWTDSGITPTYITAPDGSQMACFEDLESIVALSGGKGFVRSVVAVDTDNDPGTPDVIVRSNVEGWMDQTLLVNCESICLPFDSCPVFTGAAGAVSGSNVNVATAIGNAPLATLWEAGKSYYLDILSGPYEGHRIEIDTAASTSATLVTKASPRNTLAALPDIAGASIAVRAYKTLAEQFPPADYSVSDGSTDPDYVLIFENGSWETYYLLDVSGTPTWVNTDTGTADRGDHILDPGAGMFVHRHVSTLTQTQAGSVREAKFARPLATGYSFIPNPWPVAASVADRALVNPSAASATPFNGAASMGLADQVMLWRADTTPGQFSYDARFYLKSGALNYYTQAGSSSLINANDELIFRPLRSQYLNMKSNHSDYVMPVPWTP
jgi:protocatechuate 3,4-dioxygenase beta subunit